MANRNSLEKLDYQHLLELSIKHLLKRMQHKCSTTVRDHIALTLVSKSITQNVNLGGNLTHRIINITLK